MLPQLQAAESMLKFRSPPIDADVLLYVTDVVEKVDKNDEFLEKVQQLELPVLLLINKIDLTDQEGLEELVMSWRDHLPKAEIYPMSALNNFNVDRVQERILELLPESPPYFEKDALTDKPMRFFVTEIIREKALLIYQKEVPYAIEAVVEEYKEERDIIRIRATILVERESQKGIVIGYKGAALKKLGTLARKELERFLEKKVFLQLHVKVEKDWRNRDNMLKAFGYKLD